MCAARVERTRVPLHLQAVGRLERWLDYALDSVTMLPALFHLLGPRLGAQQDKFRREADDPPGRAISWSAATSSGLGSIRLSLTTQAAGSHPDGRIRAMLAGPILSHCKISPVMESSP